MLSKYHMTDQIRPSRVGLEVGKKEDKSDDNMDYESSDAESFQSESENELQEDDNIKKHHNDPKALEQRLRDILYDAEWIEKLDVVCDVDGLQMPIGNDDTVSESKQSADSKLQAKGTVHDDFKREMHFYCQAQVAVKQSLEKLRDLGIPTERPEVYFAEMVKTDAHMHKVREKLAYQKQARENAEKAKKIRRMKQFGKKVQQEVLQKRQEEKKKMLQAVDRIKKGKDKLGDSEDLFNIKTDHGREKQSFDKSLKRKKKDQKYGFGGKKKRMKMNTSNTASDMSGFKSSIHSKAPRNKNKSGKGKPKRLGKNRRQHVKSKKR